LILDAGRRFVGLEGQLAMLLDPVARIAISAAEFRRKRGAKRRAEAPVSGFPDDLERQRPATSPRRGVQRTTRDAEDPDEITEMLDLLFLDDLPRRARLGSS
jgi:hypothetical protein